MFSKLMLRLMSLFYALLAYPQMAVPGTPGTLSSMGATGLRRVAWEEKLRRASVRPSVWTQLKTAVKMVNGVINIEKAGIFLEISKSPDSGQSCRVAMRKPLRKAPIYGNANTILGNEDEADLLWTELYYNEIKKGVKYNRWGYDFNDTKYLDWVAAYADDITEFMAENRDVRIHQALTLTYAEELTYAPVSASQQFNKNWIIPNLSESSYPSWDLTALTVTNGSLDSDNYYSSRTYSGATTFVENIAAALLAASGTGATPKATLTVDFLSQLRKYVMNDTLIEPVMLDGKNTWIFLVASEVWSWSINPNNSGSIANEFQVQSEYKDPERMTLIGEIGRVFEHFLFIENYRAPTLTVGGSAGSYTLQVNYVQPGDNDDRNKSAWSNTSGSTNYVFDLCYVIGKNALAEYVVDPLNTDLYEQTEYKRIEGRAAYLGSGLQLVTWDKDSGSRLDGGSTTQYQRGSALVPVSRAAVQTIV
jgi:hypothetical protein